MSETSSMFSSPSGPSRFSRQTLLGAGLLAGLCIVALIYDALFPNSHIIGTNTDFANYWVGARLTLAGQANEMFSGHHVYFPHMQAAFGADYPWRTWSYPPHYLLLIWPLAFFKFDTAAVLFQALSLGFMLWAGQQGDRPVPERAYRYLMPFLIVHILLMQNGFLTAGLVLAGLNFRQRSPVVSGIFFGFLTVKPQLGLLVPVLLLVERNWYAIASAMLTTLGLVALSALLFGHQAWLGYFAITMPYQVEVIRALDGDFLGMMPGLYGTLRNFGAPADSAIHAHFIFALPVVLLYIYGMFRIRNADDRALLTLLAGFIVSPYSLFYDLGALCFVAATRVDFSGIRLRLAPSLMPLTMLCICLMPAVAMIANLTNQRFLYLPFLMAGMAACYLDGLIIQYPPNLRSP
jgi:hypothetical protein